MRKSGNKLADARTVGWRWLAIWVHSTLASAEWLAIRVHEDDADICLGYSIF